MYMVRHAIFVLSMHSSVLMHIFFFASKVTGYIEGAYSLGVIETLLLSSQAFSMNSLTITVCGISNNHCSLLGFFIGIIIESKYSHLECVMFHVHVHLSFCTCLLFPSV